MRNLECMGQVANQNKCIHFAPSRRFISSKGHKELTPILPFVLDVRHQLRGGRAIGFQLFLTPLGLDCLQDGFRQSFSMIQMFTTLDTKLSCQSNTWRSSGGHAFERFYVVLMRCT